MFWKVIGGTFGGILLIIGIFYVFDKNNTPITEIQEIKNYAENIMGNSIDHYKVNTRFNQEQYNTWSTIKKQYNSLSTSWYELYNAIDCQHHQYPFYGKCGDVQNDIVVFRNAIKDIINSVDHILIEEKITEQGLKDLVVGFKKAKATYPILVQDMYGTCDENCKLTLESFDIVIDKCLDGIQNGVLIFSGI